MYHHGAVGYQSFPLVYGWWCGPVWSGWVGLVGITMAMRLILLFVRPVDDVVSLLVP